LVDRAASDSTYLRLINVSEDPHGMCPRSFPTFWSMIDRAKVRYLRSEPIYTCPLHDSAKLHRDTLDKLNQELAKAEEQQNPTEAQALAMILLRTKVRDRQKQVNKCDVHEQHYKVARAYVKDIENNLTENEVLVFRDFVNQYNELGTFLRNVCAQFCILFCVCRHQNI
jgi:hypothetical protein